MDVLICDMLRYSSLLGAEVPLTAVNVEESLERVIEENPSLRAQRARIEIQDGLPPVHGNAAVLEQCLLVLLDNAFKHTRTGVDARLRLLRSRRTCP